MLGNFQYYNPTKLYFGEKALDGLKEELPHFGKRVLLIYGGGSIKKNGIYSSVMEILQNGGKSVVELPGVMPNPTLDKLKEGIALAREKNVDWILAVGGGSVIDYAKGVSAGVHCKGDVWERYYRKKEKVEGEVLPIGAILTMVGTGSEMNGGSVIFNTEEKLKVGRVFEATLYPKFAILNPLFTMSVPKEQMVAGCFDIFSHIAEQYFSDEDDSTSDYMMEGLFRSLIHSSRIAVRNPLNYEARSNIMWISTWALNTLVAKGKSTDWNVHSIGHAVASYTNATHGYTLSAVSLPYYHFILQDGLAKFARFARNVWEVSEQGKTSLELAQEGLHEMEKWMKELGLPLSIRDLGVKEEMLDGIVHSTLLSKNGYHVWTKEEVRTILKESLEKKEI